MIPSKDPALITEVTEAEIDVDADIFVAEAVEINEDTVPVGIIIAETVDMGTNHRTGPNSTPFTKTTIHLALIIKRHKCQLHISITQQNKDRSLK